MRRVETYVGSQCYEWIDSAQAQNTMTAIAKVCAAMFGTAGTVNGLACMPTSPAGMTVQIGAGEVYQTAPLEATICGTLPADTSHTILKQGIQLGTFTTGAFATPGTSGQSINYLIEAQYQDSDISLDPTTGAAPVVLQFYNAANPPTPWSGPNNSGSSSNTFRDGIVAYQIKAGTAATTGSQVTPSPDTGWIGLWVVTVPYGATTLTSANIAQYTGAPVLPSGMLQSILTSNLTYGIDSGTAGAVQAKFPIPVTSLVDGMDVWVKIAAANPGATTFTPNPGVISPSPVVGAAHAALQGGELVANGRANLVWRQDITSWVLVECTGAAIQIAPATASQHAVQARQVQNASAIYAVDSGSANAYAVTLSPAPTALVDGMIVAMRAANVNTGPSTLNVNGLGAVAIDGGVGVLQGGEIVFEGDYLFQYNSALPAWRLLAQSGGAVQVGAGLQSSQAVNLAQFASSIGSGSGYTKLPNGLIIQWGSATSSGTGSPNLTWTYPLAFPNQASVVTALPGAANTVVASLASATPKTTASFSVYLASSGAGYSGASVQFIAIGY